MHHIKFHTLSRALGKTALALDVKCGHFAAPGPHAVTAAVFLPSGIVLTGAALASQGE